MENIPEVWLRGPIQGIEPYLQPAAHTLLQVREDIDAAIRGLTDEQVWRRPGGAAAIGYHLHHLPGEPRAAPTYSRGESLSPDQQARLASEKTVYDVRPGLDPLLARLRNGIEEAITYLRAVPPETCCC